VEIELQEFQGFDDFERMARQIQLPRATERELSTQIRIRPGDSLLIAWSRARKRPAFDNRVRASGADYSYLAFDGCQQYGTRFLA
jgi:hypothetical protein